MQEKTYLLPYGTRVTTKGGGAIESNLGAEGVLWDRSDESYSQGRGRGAADMLESFLLAMACAGVDLDDKKIHEALNTAVESFVHH